MPARRPIARPPAARHDPPRPAKNRRLTCVSDRSKIQAYRDSTERHISAHRGIKAPASRPGGEFGSVEERGIDRHSLNHLDRYAQLIVFQQLAKCLPVDQVDRRSSISRRLAPCVGRDCRHKKACSRTPQNPSRHSLGSGWRPRRAFRPVERSGSALAPCFALPFEGIGVEELSAPQGGAIGVGHAGLIANRGPTGSQAIDLAVDQCPGLVGAKLECGCGVDA